MAKLLLIRGLPGSGKSTLAKEFVKLGYIHFEADMFFCSSGEYVYNREQLPLAHKWCFNSAKFALSLNQNVVVSNTFSQLWELEEYRKLDADIQIIECQGEFGNIHNIPDITIERMIKRWEYPYGEVCSEHNQGS